EGSEDRVTAVLRLGLVLQGDRDWIGGVEYTKNLLLAIRRVQATPASVSDNGTAVEIVPLATGSWDGSLYADMPEDFCPPVTGLPPSWHQRLYSRLLRIDRSGVRRLAKSERIDVLFPHLPGPRDAGEPKNVAWIPDLQHRILPQYFTALERFRRDWAYRRAAKKAAGVVLSSESAKRDFANHFPMVAEKTF